MGRTANGAAARRHRRGAQRQEEYEEKHYHQPSDQLSPDWNFDGMIDDARLGFFSGLDIANATSLPAWNPGDEFEAARKQALAAVAQGEKSWK